MLGSKLSGQLGDGTSTGPEECAGWVLYEACSTLPVPVSGSQMPYRSSWEARVHVRYSQEAR